MAGVGGTRRAFTGRNAVRSEFERRLPLRSRHGGHDETPRTAACRVYQRSTRR